jgi:hypothetical protein
VGDEEKFSSLRKEDEEKSKKGRRGEKRQAADEGEKHWLAWDDKQVSGNNEVLPAFTRVEDHFFHTKSHPNNCGKQAREETPFTSSLKPAIDRIWLHKSAPTGSHHTKKNTPRKPQEKVLLTVKENRNRPKTTYPNGIFTSFAARDVVVVLQMRSILPTAALGFRASTEELGGEVQRRSDVLVPCMAVKAAVAQRNPAVASAKTRARRW